MAAKVRPCLILSIPTDPQDRLLVTVVPHTTSLHGTQYEIDIPTSYLKIGAFDAQQVATVSQARLIRRIGDLKPVELSSIDDAVRRWLGL